MASLCFVIATGKLIIQPVWEKYILIFVGGKDIKIKGKGGSIAYLQQGDVEPSPSSLYLIEILLLFYYLL